MRLRSAAVESQQDSCAAALQLDGAVRSLVEGGDLDSSEHPTDRRSLVSGLLGIDRAGDDQPVDGSGHCDVVEPAPLGFSLLAARRTHLFVGGCRPSGAGRRIGDAEAEAPIGQRENLVRSRRGTVPAGVGDDDHLELETLRGVDGQEPNHVGVLLLGDGLELLRSGLVLLAHEADEALDIGSAQLLVRAG